MLNQSIKAIFGINFKMKTLVFLLIAITSTLAAPCISKNEQYDTKAGWRNGQWDTKIPEYPSKTEIGSTNGWSRDGFYVRNRQHWDTRILKNPLKSEIVSTTGWHRYGTTGMESRKSGSSWSSSGSPAFDDYDSGSSHSSSRSDGGPSSSSSSSKISSATSLSDYDSKSNSSSSSEESFDN